MYQLLQSTFFCLSCPRISQEHKLVYISVEFRLHGAEFAGVEGMAESGSSDGGPWARPEHG